ncbi:MAG: HAD family hydrolase [Cytophagaceae bacterium]
MKKVSIYLCCLLIVAIHSCSTEVKQEARKETQQVTDPLPSWNNTPLKQAIIAYVTNITNFSSKDFIPVEDRIATFDNDGTLWSEKPLVQELYCFYRVNQLLAQHPEWKNKQPFKAVAEKDKSYFEKGGMKAFVDLVLATHTGITQDEFEASVKDFYATVKYPGATGGIKTVAYQPQRELMDYLRSNGFKVYICTGGTLDFVRGISMDLYGVPREQVIASSVVYKFDDSLLMREPELDVYNDKEMKPVSIHRVIGKKPIFACGNEGGAGDIAMLKYSQSNDYPSFQLMVNHNDSIREFYYQEKDSASLKAAAQFNWNVISMKDDWKVVYVK